VKVDLAIATLLAQLPDDVAMRLDQVAIQHRPAPTAEDFARGATADHHGYYYGTAIEPVTGTELPDERPPEGVIVIFTGKLRPPTVETLARVLMHEIAHVLGYDETTIVEEMGLGVPTEAA
jgi:Zn-dependent protease with chaperone function